MLIFNCLLTHRSQKLFIDSRESLQVRAGTIAISGWISTWRKLERAVEPST